VLSLNPGSNRQAKKSTGVYLMEHIGCPGVLIECGFLSNGQEEAKLRSPEYQKQLVCVIAATAANFIS
jgi:N-acetylmuramoyl-L-alanine amidase